MKRMTAYILAIITLAVWGSLVCSTKAAELDGKSLFEKKCGLCHSKKKATSKKKTEKEWQKTVMKMKNTNGCPITNEQAEAIIQYLSQHYGK